MPKQCHVSLGPLVTHRYVGSGPGEALDAVHTERNWATWHMWKQLSDKVKDWEIIRVNNPAGLKMNTSKKWLQHNYHAPTVSSHAPKLYAAVTLPPHGNSGQMTVPPPPRGQCCQRTQNWYIGNTCKARHKYQEGTIVVGVLQIPQFGSSRAVGLQRVCQLLGLGVLQQWGLQTSVPPPSQQKMWMC